MVSFIGDYGQDAKKSFIPPKPSNVFSAYQSKNENTTTTKTLSDAQVMFFKNISCSMYFLNIFFLFSDIFGL